MEEQMIDIDIEKIMETIRCNIKRKNYNTNLLSFEDISSNNTGYTEEFEMRELDENLSYVNQNCNVRIEREIQAHGKLKKPIVFLKKVIRKCIRFYIVPIIEGQQDFNNSVTRSLNQVSQFIKSQSNSTQMIEDLNYEFNKNIKKELKLIEIKYAEVLMENQKLKNRLQEVEKEYNISKKDISTLTDKVERVNLNLDKLEFQLEKSKEV
ncbi:hypothetical protein SAMN02745136_03068 [Anaerocolumna jejuensis DSM 15929]|uniref:Uncharacterized protein n=1 Tax=Anaerocolumna jejuensis DSM 15929 TaxID=1121322 RepID=A0A1M6UFX2_9FIRM|nr:hypothetical protein [Anaerocolumna jejuensis]SHK68070.1 hypothetical protein SAMN02745136_03068 [Anaerocolumna jejuensis DSM 15929]